MSPEVFKQWRKELGLTQSDAADLLGLSRSAVIRFETGETDIKRHIALACAALKANLPAYGE